MRKLVVPLLAVLFFLIPLFGWMLLLGAVMHIDAAAGGIIAFFLTVGTMVIFDRALRASVKGRRVAAWLDGVSSPRDRSGLKR